MRFRPFFSYANDGLPDCALVKQVLLEREKHGFYAFLDEREIMPSDDVDLKIFEAIVSCDAVVAFMSNKSMESEWCLPEIRLARKCGKKIYPVMIEELKPYFEFKASKEIPSVKRHIATGDVELDAINIVADLIRLYGGLE